MNLVPANEIIGNSFNFCFSVARYFGVNNLLVCLRLISFSGSLDQIRHESYPSYPHTYGGPEPQTLRNAQRPQHLEASRL